MIERKSAFRRRRTREGSIIWLRHTRSVSSLDGLIESDSFGQQNEFSNCHRKREKVVFYNEIA